MGYGYGGHCHECYDPCGYGYGAPVGGYGHEKGGNGFALIVVLFILLIIVGACGLGGGYK